MKQPNRGDLLKVTSIHTMRKYVSVLAEEVQKYKRLNPGPTVEEMMRSELIAPVPAPAPVGRRPGARFRYASEYMDDFIRHFNRELLGMAAAQSNWEQLERFRRAEEVMGEENPIPLHALGGRTRSSVPFPDRVSGLPAQERRKPGAQAEVDADFRLAPVFDSPAKWG